MWYKGVYLEVLLIFFFICKINCICEYIVFEFLCILAFIKLGFFGYGLCCSHMLYNKQAGIVIGKIYYYILKLADNLRLMVTLLCIFPPFS